MAVWYNGICKICKKRFKRTGRYKPPVTCGDADCVIENKRLARKTKNEEYRKQGKMQKWSKESHQRKRTEEENKPEYIAEQKRKQEIREQKRIQREYEANMTCLRAVMRDEFKRALEREGKFRCWRCKTVKDLKRKGAHRHPICKKCQNEMTKDWNKRNREKYLKRAMDKYHRNMQDEQKRILIRFRDLTSKHARRAGVQGVVRGRKLDYLGCTAKELAIYLQSQFKKGMSWDNYGRKKGVRCWEIDHIKPVTAYDLTDDQQRKECFHYTNLRPMWQRQNVQKGNKHYPKQVQPSLILS